MDFMNGMMGGGSGYGASVDTITLTDRKKPQGRVGNAQAKPPTGARVAGQQSTPAYRQRQTRYNGMGRPQTRMSAQVEQNGNGFGPIYRDQSTPPPGPSPEVDGDTNYSPEIGPEGYGGEPKKKKNTALIVGGIALLGLAAAGIGYAVYKANE
jgi:hypothetical protein